MRFSLTIDCDNDAFGPSQGGSSAVPQRTRREVNRILDEVRTRVHRQDDAGAIFDVNGNKVGTFAFDPD